MKKPLLLTFFTLLLTLPSFGQPSSFDEGLKAFDAKDYGRAIALLQPYAEDGNCTAQFVMGYTYQYGLSVEKNDTLSISWLRKSAEQKQTAAMGPLAAALFGAASDDRDTIIEAYMWAMLAAEYVESQKYRTTRYVIKSYLKEDEIVKADTLIAQYKSAWKNKADCY
jgi:TPR repeat protein